MYHAPTSKETVSLNTDVTTPCGYCRHRRVRCLEEFEVVPEEDQSSEEERQSEVGSDDFEYYPPVVPPLPVPWQYTWVSGIIRLFLILVKFSLLLILAWFVETALRSGFGKQAPSDNKPNNEVECVRGGPGQFCLLE